LRLTESLAKPHDTLAINATISVCAAILHALGQAMELTYWLFYVAVGIPVGLLAGMLGIGGGSVIVPVLAIVFDQLGFDRAHIMQLAIGTSLACILASNSSAIRTHQQLGSVDWDVVRQMAPGVIIGTLAAAAVARFMPTGVLKIVFVAVMTVVLLQMMMNWQPAVHKQTLPTRPIMLSVALVIGTFSGLIGVGGAVMTVPFLVWFGVDLRRAIGTGAAVALPIAAAGTLGFMMMGLTQPRLPEWSVGYLYMPAFVGISATTIFFAPLGAKLAHRMPVKTLRHIFIVVLMLLLARMAWSV
jgi:uncharacterized protein